MTIAFLYLNALSSVGGIQKFNTNIITALDAIGTEQNHKVRLLSLHDSQIGDRPNIKFTSAKHSKFLFLLYSIYEVLKSDIIFLGHCNLAFPLTLLNKYIFKKKIYLFVHGIEVWQTLPTYKRNAINLCNNLLTVSEFTAQKASKTLGINRDKFTIFHNTLSFDNSFSIATQKPAKLLERYQLKEHDLLLLTITRLSYTEKNKGYDKVILALPQLLVKYPNLKYILAGKVDTSEKERILKLIQDLGVEEAVNLVGFITENELVAHYQLCDLFIMPSTKEGFGIVFIEATACGKPVIAGNKDGSVEALLQGQTGCLIDPENSLEISQAIDDYFSQQWPVHLTKGEILRKVTIENFGFEKMKQNLEAIIGQS